MFEVGDRGVKQVGVLALGEDSETLREPMVWVARDLLVGEVEKVVYLTRLGEKGITGAVPMVMVEGMDEVLVTPEGFLIAQVMEKYKVGVFEIPWVGPAKIGGEMILWSGGTVRPKGAPQVELKSTVATGSWTLSVTNSGKVPADLIRLELPEGRIVFFGTIAPGGTVTRTLSLGTGPFEGTLRDMWAMLESKVALSR